MQLRRRHLSAPLPRHHRILARRIPGSAPDRQYARFVAGPISSGGQSHSRLGRAVAGAGNRFDFHSVDHSCRIWFADVAPGEIKIRRGKTSSRQRPAPVAATCHRRDPAGVHCVPRRHDAPVGAAPGFPPDALAGVGTLRAGRIVRAVARFASARDGLGNFWSAASGHPANLLIAQFYLLGIAAAVYHLANGVATGAEVLGLTATPAAQQRLWRICLVTAPCCCSPAWPRGMRLQ